MGITSAGSTTVIAETLRKLCDHRLGIKEAAALFHIDEGATSEQLASRLKVSKTIAKMRISVLMRKKLIHTKNTCCDDKRYELTAKGLSIIANTTKKDAGRRLSKS